MPLYANIDGAKREVTQLYVNIGGAKKMLSEMNGNIDGAKKKIFSRYYTWAKYVSYRSGTTYGGYGTTVGEQLDMLKIFPPPYNNDSDPGVIRLLEEDSSGKYICEFTYGTGYSYTSSSGRFTLTGKTTDTLRSDMSKSNYYIEQKYIGKFVLYEYENGTQYVYKITGHNDVDYLWLGYRIERGELLYKYQYKYDSDVKSVDPNAYTSGSTRDYTSSSSSDIRTVYVKK